MLAPVIYNREGRRVECDVPFLREDDPSTRLAVALLEICSEPSGNLKYVGMMVMQMAKDRVAAKARAAAGGVN